MALFFASLKSIFFPRSATSLRLQYRKETPRLFLLITHSKRGRREFFDSFVNRVGSRNTPYGDRGSSRHDQFLHQDWMCRNALVRNRIAAFSRPNRNTGASLRTGPGQRWRVRSAPVPESERKHPFTRSKVGLSPQCSIASRSTSVSE